MGLRPFDEMASEEASAVIVAMRDAMISALEDLGYERPANYAVLMFDDPAKGEFGASDPGEAELAMRHVLQSLSRRN